MNVFSNQTLPAELQMPIEAKVEKNVPNASCSWARATIYKSADFISDNLSALTILVIPQIFLGLMASRDPNLKMFMDSSMGRSTDTNSSFIGNLMSSALSGVLSVGFGMIFGSSSHLVFKSLGIQPAGPDQAALVSALEGKAENVSTFKKIKDVIILHGIAVLCEELYFRVIIQGTLTTLAQFCGVSCRNPIQIVASAVFGLAHAKQSLTQALTAGVSSYFFEAQLYDEKGFIHAATAHFINNIIIHSIALASQNHKKNI